MRSLYNLFHISAYTKYVKGDMDVMLEKMVEGVVERRMLELFGDRNFVEKYEAKIAKAKEAKRNRA